MHVSRMFWGATADSAIVKFDEAVWELMTGIYSTRQFKMYKDHDTTIIELGLYFICDGGYQNIEMYHPPLQVV
jgi:myosin-crossreactive antigen